ncbi:putative F-box domain, leucine-rich repeat domain superfamily, F-box-like domain superfamily [Helianthus annuus]|uniref:F-box/LRR-repeat protein At1g55660 n=1 Tax=Helianthus annuus TaxID=4232 RepID=UPI000B8F05D6|nr:F-box/LRR-repeat protein At1g55660 [Helianthus annuus]KAJ0501824.1 putative F-box domain, leucine-rich repeat domain superfamily, F-box-like domain superfamily [Helianthus annuus]KAJ0509745.1 putative F-box domain, leucine-rich repeat domain superfamily, F-box-like domain superfamily [Helianthus annuus]KAJ0517751.1 putative F-box domain, leucine-rich repeat domain superfamily, F-box-like domain superfamily [Helianthus annuus]KAJ0685768.1 putative F-box domain, leucine-rich repeat domain supe
MSGTRMGDRLSSLPDDLIHKILSFVCIKHAVQTSVLSPRWRFIWTSMPYLNFLSEDFPSLPHFAKAVTNVLSRRNDRIEVASLTLSLHGRVSLAFVKRILNYAFSHNVQHMTVTCLIEKKIELPLSLFRSRSLKHLTLVGSVDRSVASTWELPALTTLHLGYVTLYKDEDEEDDEDEDEDEDDEDNNIFSKCPNMKSLTLDGCKIMGSNGLSICHPQLSNLTFENGYWGLNFFYVVVPQLKNLTIVNCDWVHLSAPDLTSFIYRSGYSLKFYTDSLPSLEEVDLCIRKPCKTEISAIVGLLQQFHRVKYLTVNLETIEVLCSSVELISNQPSPFANLRSLKIHPVDIQLVGQAQKKVVVFNEVKSYLLGGSPSASLTLVTHEEIKARDTSLAQHLMTELWVMLEQDKANINLDHMERGKAPIENCWEDLTTRSQLEKTKNCDIISKLQHIEGVLTKLPTSDKAKMQSSFSSLCAEANLVMKKIDRTHIQCGTLGMRFSVYDDELAKALHRSSKQI